MIIPDYRVNKEEVSSLLVVALVPWEAVVPTYVGSVYSRLTDAPSLRYRPSQPFKGLIFDLLSFLVFRPLKTRLDRPRDLQRQTVYLRL